MDAYRQIPLPNDEALFERPGEYWHLNTPNNDPNANPFKTAPENPRVKCLRFERSLGLAPPYYATAPAYFPQRANPYDKRLGPSPLRNVALSSAPTWSLTVALEPSQPCTLAHRRCVPGSITFQTERQYSLDQVSIPARLLDMVQQNIFDQQIISHGMARDLEGRSDSTSGNQSSANQLYSPKQVGLCNQRDSSVLRMHPREQDYRRGRQRKILFKSNVKADGKGGSKLLTSVIKQAGRLKSKFRIKSRSQATHKQSEYTSEPEMSTLYEQARPDNSSEEDICLEHPWTTLRESETNLDGFWARQSYASTTRSAQEKLRKEYADAFKLWPNPSENQAEEDKAGESSMFTEKRKPVAMAQASMRSTKAKARPVTFETVGLDVLAQVAEHSVRLHVSGCPLEPALQSVNPITASARHPNEEEGHESAFKGSQQKSTQTKSVSFRETIQVLEVDAHLATEVQAWAHYPKLAKCKDWDGMSARYEAAKRRSSEAAEGQDGGVRSMFAREKFTGT